MTSTIKVDTISENTSANGVAVDGVTLKDGQVDLADSKKILLGDGDDFLIYHDGSNSYIDNQTGELRLKTSVFKFQNANNSETMISASENGAVNLFYDNSKKFETTSAGITVTGTATVVDDISISGATPTITLTDTDDNSDCMVYQGAGNLYLEADKNGEASGSFLRIAVDDLDFVHIYNGEAVFNESSRDQDFRVESNGNANMLFVDGGEDTVKIGHSAVVEIGEAAHGMTVGGNTAQQGRLGIFRSTANAFSGELNFMKSRNATSGSHTIVNNGDNVGLIQFMADDGTDYTSTAAAIQCSIDGAPGANDTPGKLIFKTTNDGSQTATNKMSIHSTGDVSIARDTMFATYKFTMDHDGLPGMSLHNATGNNTAIGFYNGTGNNAATLAGYISVAASGSAAVAYNTSSDYRLKENVSYNFDATTRLKQLKPARFNWIADDDNTVVDGFMAHEVSDIVPEAINGTKDATETKTKCVLNADGEFMHSDVEQDDWTVGKEDGTYPSNSTWIASKVVPVYQAIDQSKLVPLLVKTIQELEARITTLEG